jgi:hypothetical protein
MGYFENSGPTDARNSVFTEVGGDYNIYTFTHSQEEEKVLAALKPVDVERRGYVHGCMEGTRKGVFKEIDGWLNDFRAPNVLWVSGCPGSGKSGICDLVSL